MLEAVAQFPIGFVVALSGALIPGPMLAFIIMKTFSYGARTGPFAVAGHVLVELAILVLIALGLGFLLQSQPSQIVVGVVGGALLAALGLLNLLKVRAKVARPKVAGLKYHPLLGGVLFSTILNPTVPLWWATVGLVMLTEAVLVASLAGAVFWILGHFLADLTWFSFISYSVARGRQLIGTKGYKALLITCGCVLLIFGAYFIFKFALLAL